MRYSDDMGASWSSRRYEVPYPLTWIDRQNVFNGSVRMMWTVDQLKVRDGVAWLGFTKIGGFPQAPPQELFFLASDNLLNETDAAKIRWRLAPDGDHGLVAPFCEPGQTDFHCGFFEECHILPLAGTSGHYACGRTAQGFLGASYTPDPTARSGWAPTEYAQYFDPLRGPEAIVPQRPSARGLSGLKHPRGPLLLKQAPGHPGRYLLLYFNQNPYGTAGSFSKSNETNYGMPYQPSTSGSQRNPYWLAAGIEECGEPCSGSMTGTVLWSQPEIALFVRGTGIDAHLGTLTPNAEAGGYADFVWLRRDGEAEPALFITETDKSVARIHRVEKELLDGLFAQHRTTAIAREPAVALSGGSQVVDALEFPAVFGATPGSGWSVALLLANHSRAAAGQAILDDRDDAGRGVSITVGAGGAAVFAVSDSSMSFNLSTDAACSATLASGSKPHALSFVADASAGIVTALVDGVLCDGAAVTPRGFGWLPPQLGAVPAARRRLWVAHGYSGALLRGHLWARALRTSEAVATARQYLAQ